MAIIKCEKCGREISDTMQACPHCGYERRKEQKKSALAYKGNMAKELLGSIIPAMLVIMVSIIAETLNKKSMELYGMNAVDSYVISQNCLPMLTRALVLVIVFAICGVVTFFVMKKSGERIIVRLIIGGIAVAVYTIIMVGMTNTNVAPLLGGREELYSYVLVISRQIGIFCGIAYGLTTAMMYLCAHYQNTKNVVLFSLVEFVMFVVAMLIKNYLFARVLGHGVNAIYSFGALLILIILLIVTFIVMNKLNEKRN